MGRPPELRSARLLAVATLLAGACSRGAEPPSVLLVTLDTTRADRLGCYGREGADTPVLDALAGRGVRFERAWTTAPLTLPAHTSILTGTSPLHHGVRDNGTYHADPRLVTLAECLRDGGWRTAAFVSAEPLHAEFGLDQGFELYDSEWNPARADPGLADGERRGGTTVATALPWLERYAGDGPFFLWVHLFDPHWAYAPPPDWTARHPDDPYQGEIAYADQCVGRLLEALEERGLLAHTLVAVVGDHGEALGEHGELTHSLLAYDATLRVPLILAGPGVPGGTAVERPVSVVDLLPTLLELADLPVPADVQGRSLVPSWSAGDFPDEPLYMETWYPPLNHGWSELQAVVDGRWKLIEAPRAGGDPCELYDLEADPGELVDLADREPERVAALRARLDELRAQLAPDVPLDARHEPADGTLGLLRQLGYAGGEGVEPRISDGSAGPLPDPARMVESALAADRALDRLAADAPAEALADLLALERDDPDGLQTLEMRGLYELALAADDPAHYASAIDAFRAALARDPTRAKNWTRLAVACRRSGDHRAALESQWRAMELAPVTAEARSVGAILVRDLKREARLLEARGDLAEAQAAWELLAEGPEDEPAYAREVARLAELRAAQ